jgi:hypothetical protein
MDATGTVPLELAASNFGDHRLRFDKAARPNDTEQYSESARSVITVRTTTLDTVLRHNDRYARTRRIDLLKLDCQGSEIAVLKGAREAVANTRYLLAEYWPYGIRRTGAAPEEFLEIIAGNFARFARVRNGAPQFQPVSMLRDDARTVSRLTDYLFVK